MSNYEPEENKTPLLVITEQPTEAKLCAMLRAGADLVLPRPVSPRVLTNYARLFQIPLDIKQQSPLVS